MILTTLAKNDDPTRSSGESRQQDELSPVKEVVPSDPPCAESEARFVRSGCFRGGSLLKKSVLLNHPNYEPSIIRMQWQSLSVSIFREFGFSQIRAHKLPFVRSGCFRAANSVRVCGNEAVAWNPSVMNTYEKRVGGYPRSFSCYHAAAAGAKPRSPTAMAPTCRHRRILRNPLFLEWHLTASTVGGWL